MVRSLHCRYLRFCIQGGRHSEGQRIFAPVLQCDSGETLLRPESAVINLMRTLHAPLLQLANKEECQSDTLAPRQLLLSSTKIDNELKMSS